MIKKSRTLFSLQSLLLIVTFVALGVFWKDPVFPCLLNLFAWCFVIIFVASQNRNPLAIGIPVLEAFICNLYVYSAYAAFGSLASESVYYAHLLAPSFMKVAVLALVVPAVVLTILSVFVVKHRKMFVHLAVLISLILPGYYASILVCNHIRETAVYSLIDQLKPLVHAIDAYKRDNGYPPGELVQLVPKYISSVPVPKLFTLPRMEYALVGPYNWSIVLMSPYDSNEILLYNSERNYDNMKGTRINDWFYTKLSWNPWTG